MREVKDMATTLRMAVQRLKTDAAASVAEFRTEASNAAANISKVKALTSDLKNANKEVEEVLRASGSNFPTSEEPSKKPQDGSGGVDQNGVTAGEGTKPEHVDQNGVTKT